MQQKYRMYRRESGTFYWQEHGTSSRGSLRTKDRAEALRLLVAKNASHEQPTLNLALGRTYLSAYDPEMPKRTWQVPMDEMSRHGRPSTQLRCTRAMRSHAFDSIRNKPLVETT